MVGALQRVLVCSPKTAGWDSAAMRRPLARPRISSRPDFEAAQSQHAVFCANCIVAGAEIIELAAADRNFLSTPSTLTMLRSPPTSD